MHFVKRIRFRYGTDSSFRCEKMTQVNHGKSEIMTAQEISGLTIKADQESAKLVNPGKASFATKTPLVNTGVEKAFAPPFRLFAVALVLGNIGDKLVIETNFARVLCIESTISIKVGTRDAQSMSFHLFEGGL